MMGKMDLRKNLWEHVEALTKFVFHVNFINLFLNILNGEWFTIIKIKEN